MSYIYTSKADLAAIIEQESKKAALLRDELTHLRTLGDELAEATKPIIALMDRDLGPVYACGVREALAQAAEAWRRGIAPCRCVECGLEDGHYPGCRQAEL